MSKTNAVSRLTLHVLSTNTLTSLEGCVREFKSLAALSSENLAVGWAISPDSCAAMRMTDSDVQQMPSDSSVQGKPFEVRLFTKDYDVRWLQVRPGLGRAAIVTELHVNDSELATLGENWKLACHEQVEPIRDQNYLVWGKVLASVPDSAWTTMTDARIGEIQVPVSNANKGQSVVLKYVEYLHEADEDGNVVVFEERLCGFLPR